MSDMICEQAQKVDGPLFRSLGEVVQARMGNLDGSHDVEHVLRVTVLALRIAREEWEARKEEGPCRWTSDAEPTTLDQLQREVLVLAMIHDLTDHKYCEDPTEMQALVHKLLCDHGFDAQRATWVQALVPRISYSHEMKQRHCAMSAQPDQSTGSSAAPALPLVLCAVQDADRLDAMGAVGIARCFTFGGSRNRSLYTNALVGDASVRALAAETPKDLPGGSMYHFYEKLTRLRDFMKTDAGRRRAERRHRVLERFVADFWNEVEEEN